MYSKPDGSLAVVKTAGVQAPPLDTNLNTHHRKLEQATFDSIAFRFICANTHRGHDTIAAFRKRVPKEWKSFFVAVLLVGKALGLVTLGAVSLDATKIRANASRHKALRWAHANELEVQLQAQVEALMRLAESDSISPTTQTPNR